MMNLRIFFQGFCNSVLGAALFLGLADVCSGQDIRSGVPWFDTNHHLMNAHGCGFIKDGDTYYMIGEKRVDGGFAIMGDIETGFAGMSLYSSKDLMNWTYEGDPITPLDHTEIAKDCIVERPKLLRNDATGEYIIYMHNWTGEGNVCYATSSNVKGPYIYRGLLRTAQGKGLHGGDLNVFKDDDGKAYLLETEARIFRLSDDYKSVDDKPAAKPISQSGLEAPAMFKANGTYYFLCSHMSWWDSNDNLYATASAINDKWQEQGCFAPKGTHTWNSQTTDVLPIQGKTATLYIFMADRWCDSHLMSTTNVWQPLTLSGGKLSLPTFIPVWRVDANEGASTEIPASGISLNFSNREQGDCRCAFSGDWQAFGDSVKSDHAGDQCRVEFSGRQVSVYSEADRSNGMLGLELDDSSGKPVCDPVAADLYSSAMPEKNVLCYSSPPLAPGRYVLSIKNNNLKNHYAKGASVYIDKIEVVK